MEKMYVTRICGVGTSTGMVIPAELVRALHLQRGDSIVFGVFDEDNFFCRRLTDAEIRSIKPKVVKV